MTDNRSPLHFSLSFPLWTNIIRRKKNVIIFAITGWRHISFLSLSGIYFSSLSNTFSISLQHTSIFLGEWERERHREGDELWWVDLHWNQFLIWLLYISGTIKISFLSFQSLAWSFFYVFINTNRLLNILISCNWTNI